MLRSEVCFREGDEGAGGQKTTMTIFLIVSLLNDQTEGPGW